MFFFIASETNVENVSRCSKVIWEAFSNHKESEIDHWNEAFTRKGFFRVIVFRGGATLELSWRLNIQEDDRKGKDPSQSVAFHGPYGDVGYI